MEQPRQHLCSVEGCGKAFSRKEHLSRHEKTHDPENILTCKVCAREFNRKYGNVSTCLFPTFQLLSSRTRHVTHFRYSKPRSSHCASLCSLLEFSAGPLHVLFDPHRPPKLCLSWAPANIFIQRFPPATFGSSRRRLQTSTLWPQ